jgi:osmoprotectant transport system permease protein
LLILSPIGVSTTATEIALVAFALPPIVTNAYVGVSEVDAELLDVARGMGMSGWQRFRRVELPLAVPLVMAGVRIAAVQVVATATIAALVGSGGLGRLVEDGLRQDDRGQLLTGAVLVALLALVVELSLAMVQRRLDPLRRARTRGSAAASVTEM